MTPAQIKLALEAGLLLLVILSSMWLGYHFTREHYQKIIAADALAAQKLVDTAKDANDTLKTKLEVNHVQAVAAINTIMSVPLPRVRLPACPQTGQAQPSGGSVSSVESARVLSEKIGRILDADRSRIKAIIGEAESELADCRVIKEWAVKQ